MGSVFETVAYHKNGYLTAKLNISTQKFFVSESNEHKIMWLGKGIYFWKRKQDAEWWPGQYDTETILSAKLTCPVERYIDLDDPDEKQDFLEYCEEVQRLTGNEVRIPLKFQDRTNAMVVAFANAYKRIYDILLMKYSFPNDNRRPQYCATDNSVVSDIQIVATTKGNRLVWYI